MAKINIVSALSISCLFVFPSYTAEGQAIAKCPSVYNVVASRVSNDPDLKALHLDQMSCATLSKLTEVLGAAGSRKKMNNLQLSSLTPVMAAADSTKISTTADPNQPKHGTAEYAQQNAQRFYVRQNALDAFYYLYPSVPDPKSTASGSATKASGASISWTDDQLSHSQVFNVQVYSAYVIGRQLDIRAPDEKWTPYISKWAIAPWVYANGALNQPSKATDKNALQFGGEMQFEVSRLGPFAITDFRAAPYYQTDFRGIANIQGIDALAEPYNISWFLGGADHAILNNFVFFYWRLIGEADIRHVTAAGLSNMKPNTEYAWLGGSLQLKASFFPDSPEPAIANRFYFTGTAQWFDSVSEQSDLHNYVAEFGYNLDPAGTSSISLQYSHGTDKSTLVNASQYKAQLNFKM